MSFLLLSKQRQSTVLDLLLLTRSEVLVQFLKTLCIGKKATSEFSSLDLLSCSHLSYIHISFMPILNTSILYIFFMLNIFYRKNIILLFIYFYLVIFGLRRFLKRAVIIGTSEQRHLMKTFYFVKTGFIFFNNAN